LKIIVDRTRIKEAAKIKQGMGVHIERKDVDNDDEEEEEEKRRK
jgi:hypothetical protein